MADVVGSGRDDAFQRVWSRVAPSQRREIEDDWPQLKRVARMCAESRPELSGELLSFLVGECGDLAISCSRCVWNGTGPPYPDGGLQVARDVVARALGQRWPTYDPDKGTLAGYVRSKAMSDVKRLQCYPRPKPAAPLDEEEPDPRPDPAQAMWAKRERGERERLSAVFSVALAELLLGGPPPGVSALTAPGEVEPPHRGIPWWAIRYVEGNAAHSSGSAVKDFAREHGSQALRALADGYVEIYWMGWSDDRGADLRAAIEGALERLDERLDVPVRTYLGGRRGAGSRPEWFMAQVTGESKLEDYAHPADLVRRLHDWLDQTGELVRRVLHQRAMELQSRSGTHTEDLEDGLSDVADEAGALERHEAGERSDPSELIGEEEDR